MKIIRFPALILVPVFLSRRIKNMKKQYTLFIVINILLAFELIAFLVTAYIGYNHNAFVVVSGALSAQLAFFFIFKNKFTPKYPRIKYINYTYISCIFLVAYYYYRLFMKHNLFIGLLLLLLYGVILFYAQIKNFLVMQKEEGSLSR